jgi:cytochrome c
MKTLAAFGIFCALIVAGDAIAAGDAAKGERIFNQCRICHSLETGKNLVGPSLNGVIGRKSGMADGYRYSDAMAKAGIVWNDETLAKYLKNPKEFVPGNKMSFAGLKSDDDIANVIAYLNRQAK